MPHSRMILVFGAALLCLSFVTTVQSLTFTDVTEAVGIDPAHTGNDTFHMGAGVAWVDFDNDGDYDLYALHAGPN